MRHLQLFEEFINESVEELFPLYKECIELCRKSHDDKAKEPTMERIFAGSKISGDFIFRYAVLKGEPKQDKHFTEYVKRHGEGKVKTFLEKIKRELA
jgi:hypothetical protein